MLVDLERGNVMSLVRRGSTTQVVAADEGATRGFVSDVYTVKLTADQTAGSFGMIHAWVPPGGGPPPHIHHEADEIFYLLDGTLDFQDGEQIRRASSGDTVFLPRGTVHRFHNSGTKPALMLFMYTPGGSEGMFLEQGDIAEPGVALDPWGPERLTEDWAAALRRFDTFVVKESGQ
jgi:mannose-6-phosphate isomerase-like protein (cupin superfamily)